MNIMILGAGVMQIPAIKKAKEMKLFVICADGNPDAIGKNLCDVFYAIDIKDKNGLLELAKDFNDKHKLDGVFTVGTDFSTSVAWIAENLNLPGIPYQSALNATDKVRMRKCFKKQGVPSPLYVEYSEGMDLKESIKNLNYPLVVKPVDSMGSRGVRRINNFEELEDNIKSSVNFSRTSRAIIEQYIDGPEYSLDALIVNGEVHVFGFADREIVFPPYFVEMGHNIPTNIDKTIMDEIISVFTLGVKSLGINNGSAKGDMKYSKNGPVIGEIAARLSGGYMSGWTYPYSSGIDLIKGGIELSLGLNLTINKENDLNKFSSERAFISIPGVVKDINVPKEKSKDIKDVFVNIKKGDKVVFPKNNVEKCGNIISLSKSREIAIKSSEKFASEILIRLKPNVWETQEYLFNDNNTNISKAFDFDYDLISDLDDSVEIENNTIYIKKIDKIINSRKKDWQKRSVSGVLKILEGFYKIEFIEESNCGLEFYKSLINGSIQGVLYYLDTIEM